MSDDERRTYTVTELINTLSDVIGSKQVEVYSGCHDCGGAYLEVDIYGDSLQITGYQWPPANEDDE